MYVGRAGSFSCYKEKKSIEGTFIAPPSYHMETVYDRKRFIRNMTIRNLCVKRCNLYENER